MDVRDAFYVYAYHRPGDAAPFYIGKGRGRRFTKQLVAPHNPGIREVLDELLGQGQRPEAKILVYIKEEKEACRIEKALIKSYGRASEGGPLANISLGGPGNSGWKWSAESRAVWRAGVVGKKRTPEQRARISESLKGKTVAEATKAKLRTIANAQWSSEAARRERSENQKQRMSDPAEREKVRVALRGHKQSPEQIEKRVAPWRGVPRPKEFTEPCRLAKIGKPRTEECKAKISASKVKLRGTDIQKIISLREFGLPFRAIGKRVGVSHMTVINTLKRHSQFVSV